MSKNISEIVTKVRAAVDASRRRKEGNISNEKLVPIQRPSNFKFESYLPPELWNMITSTLTIKDLAHLSRSCTYFMAVIRPELYDYVYLDPERDYDSCQATIRMLKHNKQLATAVTDFHLRPLPPSKRRRQAGPPKKARRILIPNALQAICNMTRLVALDLHYTIFRGERDQRVFVEAVQEGRVPVTHVNFSRAELYGETFALPGMKTVMWDIPKKGVVHCHFIN